jgi:hypothetical protein
MSEITTTPAHAGQARELLSEAADARCSTAYRPGFIDHGVGALRDAQVATGHALLAIREELAKNRAQAELQQLAVLGEVAALRRDVRDFTAAVRELTGAVSAAPAPLAMALVDVSNAIADVRTEFAGTADIATAVESLTAAVDAQTAAVDEQGPRRRWWRWGR